MYVVDTHLMIIINLYCFFSIFLKIYSVFHGYIIFLIIQCLYVVQLKSPFSLLVIINQPTRSFCDKCLICLPIHGTTLIATISLAYAPNVILITNHNQQLMTFVLKFHAPSIFYLFSITFAFLSFDFCFFPFIRIHTPFFLFQ